MYGSFLALKERANRLKDETKFLADEFMFGRMQSSNVKDAKAAVEETQDRLNELKELFLKLLEKTYDRFLVPLKLIKFLAL